MSREVIITQGTFSRLTIQLNQDMINKLALIKTEENPLARVEAKLKKAHQDFEKAYFKATSK